MRFDSKTGRQAGKVSSRTGVKNKTSKKIRETFQILIEANLERLQSDLDSLEPICRIQVILQLSRFVIPTLKAIEYTGEDGEDDEGAINPIIVKFVKDGSKEPNL